MPRRLSLRKRLVSWGGSFGGVARIPLIIRVITYTSIYNMFFPQIALAIGVLTSNRRGFGYQLWRSSRWVPL